MKVHKLSAREFLTYYARKTVTISTNTYHMYYPLASKPTSSLTTRPTPALSTGAGQSNQVLPETLYDPSVKLLYRFLENDIKSVKELPQVKSVINGYWPRHQPSDSCYGLRFCYCGASGRLFRKELLCRDGLRSRGLWRRKDLWRRRFGLGWQWSDNWWRKQRRWGGIWRCSDRDCLLQDNQGWATTSQ